MPQFLGLKKTQADTHLAGVLQAPFPVLRALACFIEISCATGFFEPKRNIVTTRRLIPILIVAGIVVSVAGAAWLWGNGFSSASAAAQANAGPHAAGTSLAGAASASSLLAEGPAGSAPSTCSTAAVSPFGATGLSPECEDELAQSASTATHDDPDAPQVIAAQVAKEKDSVQQWVNMLQTPAVVDERTFDLSNAVSGCVSAPGLAFWESYCEQVIAVARVRYDQLLQLQNVGDADAQVLSAHALYALANAKTSHFATAGAEAQQPMSSQDLQIVQTAAALRARLQMSAPPVPALDVQRLLSQPDPL